MTQNRKTEEERVRGRARKRGDLPPLAESVVPALGGVAVAVPEEEGGGREVSGEKGEEGKEKDEREIGTLKHGRVVPVPARRHQASQTEKKERKGRRESALQ